MLQILYSSHVCATSGASSCQKRILRSAGWFYIIAIPACSCICSLLWMFPRGTHSREHCTKIKHAIMWTFSC